MSLKGLLPLYLFFLLLCSFFCSSKRKEPKKRSPEKTTTPCLYARYTGHKGATKQCAVRTFSGLPPRIQWIFKNTLRQAKTNPVTLLIKLPSTSSTSLNVTYTISLKTSLLKPRLWGLGSDRQGIPGIIISNLF